MEEPEISRGERTRQEILVAAKSLFISQGFTATPMRQIARQVGITPAAIYNHYPGKDQLFTALLQDAAPYDELFALFDTLAADSAEELVRQMLRGALATLTAHQDYLQLAFIDAQERDGAALVTLLPAVFPRAQAWYERLVALDAGQRHRQLRLTSFVVFFRTMVSLLVGFMLTERVVKSDLLPQLAGIDWEEALVEFFLHGMLEPPERGEEGDAGR
jgi:AcrR family transcriptional regulator